MRALIVDDSRAMRTILKGILKGLGFETFEAGHGKEGLRLLKTCIRDAERAERRSRPPR